MGESICIKRICKLLCMFIAIAIFAEGCPYVSASQQQTQTAQSNNSDNFSKSDKETFHTDTMRVAITEFPGYAYTDENGNLAGSAVEYAYSIAQYAGINKVEITLVKDAESYFNLLDTGKVDMLFEVIKNRERESKYIFSAYSTGSTSMSLYVKSDNNDYEYGNILQLHKMVFGAESGNYVSDLFREWCSQYGITPEIKEYRDLDALNKALSNNEFDAVIYSSDSMPGYKTILQFSYTPFYIAFRHDSPELKAQIDDAMGRININSPYYLENLEKKYASDTVNLSEFTTEEKKYIASNPTVSVAVVVNDMPFYYVNGNGEAAGIIPDYYKKISDITGLNFTYSGYDTYEEAVNAVIDGHDGLLSIYSGSIVEAFNSGLSLTSPYATVNMVELTHADESSAITRIAVKGRRLAIAKKIFSGYEDMEYKVYEDSAECLSALKDGSADAIICSYPTAAWMLNQVVSSSYAMSALNSYSCELDGAVPKGNILLWSILNKAIVSSNDFDEIMNSNTRPQTNLFTMVSRLPARLIIAFGIIMLFLAICSLYALILVLHRQHERNAAAAKKSEYEARQAKLAIIEKNNEDKNQFFSNISHDMRTPLNAIIGFSAMGEKETDISKLKEYLYKIQTSGRLLLELINDTLTISKINNGKYNLNPAPVDVYKLIDESSVSIIEAAKIKKVNLKIMRPAQNRIIIADGLALQKIFLNLLSNAVKFTPAGGNVKISFEQIPSGISVPDTLCTVTDSGIGISEEFLPHIYEPFAQETFSSSKSAGTGLGLSIVKQLVDMMGGTIDVSSTLNIGTTFTLRFHFDTAPMENADDSHVNTDYSVENLAGKKMLVCEDNELNREIACAMLNSFGIKTFFAENGRDGVDAFLKSSCYEYSAILMDLSMPVMDGMEAARAIRKSDRPDAITVPIIAMTADAFDDDVKKCLVSGMNAHIAKPLEPSRVKEVLCHYVKNA